MNVIKEVIKYNKEITEEDIVFNKDIVIDITATTKNGYRLGKYKLIRYYSKDLIDCIKIGKVPCERLCKKYCLYFKHVDFEQFIWSCHIKKWRLIDECT